MNVLMSPEEIARNIEEEVEDLDEEEDPFRLGPLHMSYEEEKKQPAAISSHMPNAKKVLDAD